MSSRRARTSTKNMQVKTRLGKDEQGLLCPSHEYVNFALLPCAPFSRACENNVEGVLNLHRVWWLRMLLELVWSAYLDGYYAKVACICCIISKHSGSSCYKGINQRHFAAICVLGLLCSLEFPSKQFMPNQNYNWSPVGDSLQKYALNHLPSSLTADLKTPGTTNSNLQQNKQDWLIELFLDFISEQ